MDFNKVGKLFLGLFLGCLIASCRIGDSNSEAFCDITIEWESSKSPSYKISEIEKETDWSNIVHVNKAFERTNEGLHYRSGVWGDYLGDEKALVFGDYFQDRNGTIIRYSIQTRIKAYLFIAGVDSCVYNGENTSLPLELVQGEYSFVLSRTDEGLTVVSETGEKESSFKSQIAD